MNRRAAPRPGRVQRRQLGSNQAESAIARAIEQASRVEHAMTGRVLAEGGAGTGIHRLHKASGWFGEGVVALGLRGPVKTKRFEVLFAGYVPGTDL